MSDADLLEADVRDADFRRGIAHGLGPDQVIELLRVMVVITRPPNVNERLI
jgi:hypothetical protein